MNDNRRFGPFYGVIFLYLLFLPVIIYCIVGLLSA